MKTQTTDKEKEIVLTDTAEVERALQWLFAQRILLQEAQHEEIVLSGTY